MTRALMVRIKFFVPLPGKVHFGVWIDILEKGKFLICAKIFFSYFHLFIICI